MDNIRDNLDRLGRRVWFELRKDKRKTTVLAALLVLVAVLGLKLTVSGPQSSRAAEADDVATVPDITAVRESLSSEGRSAEDSPRAEYIRSIDRDITRDIFQPKLGAFGAEGEASGTEGLVEADDGQDIEEARRRRVQAEANALRLQSTAVSATSTAIINGRVLREGETINGFRLVEIKPHTCLIEKEGVRIRLRMRR